ncbi:hypothetical protein LX32DRAFT_691076 [Colletotrichum zoysiae]|uniref:Uncharacterized protein n=1 Tax=Colletotrichum zoysiae TaxID=1216348 RepID=A0AAD9HQD6_9PEZI|nr:hypothetical protein LX32DRAFT_691076 [Colletotrichum zoysiae]
MPIGHPGGPRDCYQYVLIAAVRLNPGNEDIDRIRTFYAAGLDVVPQSVEEHSNGDRDIGAPEYTYHLYYILSQAHVKRLTPEQREEHRGLHMKRNKWSRQTGEVQQMPDDCMADISREEAGKGAAKPPKNPRPTKKPRLLFSLKTATATPNLPSSTNTASSGTF